jgi:hypothetical protein
LELTDEGTVLGTAEHMSPEQVRGETLAVCGPAGQWALALAFGGLGAAAVVESLGARQE